MGCKLPRRRVVRPKGKVVKRKVAGMTIRAARGVASLKQHLILALASTLMGLMFVALGTSTAHAAWRQNPLERDREPPGQPGVHHAQRGRGHRRPGRSDGELHDTAPHPAARRAVRGATPGAGRGDGAAHCHRQLWAMADLRRARERRPIKDGGHDDD